MAKRAAPQEDGTLIKRARSSEPEANNQQQLAISSSNDERQKALIRSVKRTSNLEAPIVSLSGAHGVSFQGQCLLGAQRNAPLQAEILSCRFDPTGQNIAACSADRGICASRPSRSYFLISVSLTNSIFQRYGERIPQIRIMGSSPQYTKRPYWTSNGPYSRPFFTVFQ